MPEIKAPQPMHRVNTRIRVDQNNFIKAVAKKTKATQGEVFRAIIDVAMEADKK